MQSSWADNSAADQLAASTSNTSTANNNITNYSTVTSGDSASSRPAGPARSTYIPPHLRRTHQTSTDSKPHPEPISAPPPSAAATTTSILLLFGSMIELVLMIIAIVAGW